MLHHAPALAVALATVAGCSSSNEAPEENVAIEPEADQVEPEPAPAPEVDTTTCVYDGRMGIAEALPAALVWSDDSQLFASLGDDERSTLAFHDGCWRRLAYPASLDPRVDEEVPRVIRVRGTPEAPVFLYEDGTIARGTGDGAVITGRQADLPGKLLESWVDPAGGFVALVVGAKSEHALITSREGSWSWIQLPAHLPDARAVVFPEQNRMAVSDHEAFGIYDFDAGEWIPAPLNANRLGVDHLTQMDGTVYVSAMGGIHALSDGTWSTVLKDDDVLFDAAFPVAGTLWFSGISPAGSATKKDRILYALTDGTIEERQRFQPDYVGPLSRVIPMGDVALLTAGDHRWRYADGAWSPLDSDEPPTAPE